VAVEVADSDPVEDKVLGAVVDRVLVVVEGTLGVADNNRYTVVIS